MPYHLAQVNIGKFRKPPVDPVNADFMSALDRVNASAEASLRLHLAINRAGQQRHRHSCFR